MQHFILVLIHISLLITSRAPLMTTGNLLWQAVHFRKKSFGWNQWLLASGKVLLLVSSHYILGNTPECFWLYSGCKNATPLQGYSHKAKPKPLISHSHSHSHSLLSSLCCLSPHTAMLTGHGLTQWVKSCTWCKTSENQSQQPTSRVPD